MLAPKLIVPLDVRRLGDRPCLLDRGSFSSAPRALLFREGAISDDRFALNAAKPAQGEMIALPRDGDGAVRAAAAFFGLALGDDFDKEDIGFRRSGPRKLSRAIEVGILRLRSFGADGELEIVGGLTVDL
jgi:hypothetical protein